MNDSQIAPPGPGGRIRPGEVRNPHGRNQYSYRRDFERTPDKLLAGELTDDELGNVAEVARDLVEPGMSRGDAIARVLVGSALHGEQKCLLEVVKRLWPETQKHELTAFAQRKVIIEGAPDMSMLTAEEQAQARALARKMITRGSGQREEQVRGRTQES